MKSFILFIFVSLFSINLLIAEQNQQRTLQHFNNKDKSHFFIENKGQWDSEILYLAKINGMNAWITKSGVVYDYYRITKGNKATLNDEKQFPDKFINEKENSSVKGHVIRMTYEQDKGNSDLMEFSGIDKHDAYYNYFLGSDQTKWAVYVGLYNAVLIKNSFNGIDTKYYYDKESKGSIRYDFIVNPQSDVSNIKLNFDLGKDKSYYYTVNEDKELVFKTNIGEISHTKLFAYQETDGIKKEIECTFSVNKDGSVGFTVGNYDNTKPLIIDPLVYSTFLGGSLGEYAYSIAIDSSGCVAIAGYTYSSDFPTTPGAYDESFDGGDGFITKLNSSGSSLIYSTFISGSVCNSIVFDSFGNSYVTGTTSSSNFPTTPGCYDDSFNGGNDIFIIKLNSSGSSLIYSTYIGGSSWDYAYTITIDSACNCIISGITNSNNFPTTPGCFSEIYVFNYFEVFVAKLNSNGSSLIYSTGLGESTIGFYDDRNNVISSTIDNEVNAYVTGWTEDQNFPTTFGAYSEIINGLDVFVSKLNSSGSDLIYSTFIGGNGGERGNSIVLDNNNEAYITGWTQSSDYPTTNNAYNVNLNGNQDVFITKLNNTGSDLVFSTYIGGSSDEESGQSITIDNSGNSYITGYSNSNDYPTTNGAFDTSYNGRVNSYGDVIVTKLNSNGTTLLYSTFIGGSNDDVGESIVIDNFGDAYIAGFTHSSNYPTTIGSFDESYNGDWDAIITKLQTVTIPIVPTLIFPQNNSIHISINSVFSWNAAPEATSYCLQISTSSDFGILIINDSTLTATNRPTTGLSYNTTYFWRVNAKNIAGTSPWSEVWNFTTECDPNQLFSISGIVSYNNTQGTPLSNCTVNLIDSSGYLTLQTFTDNNGYYYFGYVYPGDYKIEVTTTKPRGGFNVLDVVLTRQEIAFLIQFTPLQVKAADVNKNNSLNMLDVVYMKQKLAFLNPPQWIIPDYVFEVPTINVCGENVIVNIKALCAGDVNGSYVPPQ